MPNQIWFLIGLLGFATLSIVAMFWCSRKSPDLTDQYQVAIDRELCQRFRDERWTEGQIQEYMKRYDRTYFKPEEE